MQNTSAAGAEGLPTPPPTVGEGGARGVPDAQAANVGEVARESIPEPEQSPNAAQQKREFHSHHHSAGAANVQSALRHVSVVVQPLSPGESATYVPLVRPSQLNYSLIKEFISDGNFEALKELVPKGTPKEVVSWTVEGKSLLDFAVALNPPPHNHLRMVNFLLLRGADPKNALMLKTSEQATSEQATSRQTDDRLRLLLQTYCAPPSEEERDESTKSSIDALEAAMETGDTLLLDTMAQCDEAVFSAVLSSSHPELCIMMVENRQITGEVLYNGKFLRMACEQGAEPLVVEILQQALASSPDSINVQELFEASVHASLNGVAQVLLENEQFRKQIDTDNGYPLRLAYEKNNQSLIAMVESQLPQAFRNAAESLLPHAIRKADTAFLAKCIALCKPKEIAAFSADDLVSLSHQNRLDTIDLLLKHNLITKEVFRDYCKVAESSEVILLIARSPAFKEESRRLLWLVAENRNQNLAVKLLEHQQESLVEPNGKSLLHHACFTGNLQLLIALHKKGEELNRADLQQRAAIHYACLGGQVEVVKWLMSRDPNCLKLVDGEGRAAPRLACTGQNPELVLFLFKLLPEDALQSLALPAVSNGTFEPEAIIGIVKLLLSRNISLPWKAIEQKLQEVKRERFLKLPEMDLLLLELRLRDPNIPKQDRRLLEKIKKYTDPRLRDLLVELAVSSSPEVFDTFTGNMLAGKNDKELLPIAFVCAAFARQLNAEECERLRKLNVFEPACLGLFVRVASQLRKTNVTSTPSETFSYLLTLLLQSESHREFADRLAFVQFLIATRSVDRIHTKSSLNALRSELEGEFYALVWKPTQGVEDYHELFITKFKEFRRPTVMMVLAYRFQSLSSSEREVVMESFVELLSALITDDYPKTRYRLDISPHLNAIFATRPQLLQTWRTNTVTPLVEFLLKHNLHKDSEAAGIDLKAYEKWQIVETDSLDDIVNMGTEVLRSCISVDDDRGYNKCLLNAALDGKCKLAAIKDENGVIVTRAILRLLIQEKPYEQLGETVPSLFMEKTYEGRQSNAVLLKALGLFCQKKAVDMKVTARRVPTADETVEEERPLISLSKRGPAEYVDALMEQNVAPGFRIPLTVRL